MKIQKTTISHIAEELGVSKTLVSFVLNGKGEQYHISQKTCQKVLSKAEELNYKPNLYARGLRLGKSNTIGLIVADISNPFYAKIARIIEDYADRNKYSLIIASSDEKPEKEERLIEMLRDRQVDGIIISPTNQDKKKFNTLTQEGFPYVMIDRTLGGIKCNSVTIDNEQASYMLTKHLLNEGHRKIAHFSISPYYLSTIKKRAEGFKMALSHAGIPKQDIYHKIIDFDKIEEQVNKALQELVIKEPLVTAIYTSNNYLAVTCMKAARQLNIKIPEDIALVSFDDIELFEFIKPGITSVAQPISLLAIRAAEMLINAIEYNNTEPEQIVLPTEIKIRESSKLVKQVI